MNRRITELREVITKLTKLLAGKNLEVTQQGTSAYVKADPVTLKPFLINIPHLPDNASEELINATQGFIDHEISHVLHTDWSVVAEARKMGPLIASLHNIIEDTFIEREVCKIFPGSKYNLERLYNFFLSNVTEPALKSAAGDDKHQFSIYMPPICRALSGQRRFQDFMKDHMEHPSVKSFYEKLPKKVMDAVPAVSTSREALNVAIDIYNVIMAPPEKEEEEKKEEDTKDKSKSKSKDKSSSFDPKDKEEEKKDDKKSKDSVKDDDKPDDETDDSSISDEDSSDQLSGDGETDDEDPSDGEKSDSEEPFDEEHDGDAGEESFDGDADEDEPSDEEFDDEEFDDEETGINSSQRGDASGTRDGKPDGESDGEDAKTDEIDETGEPTEVGKPESSLLSETEELADFNEAISGVIEGMSAAEMQKSPYVVFTTDDDVIEPLTFPDRAYKDVWLTNMNEKIGTMTSTMRKDIERMIAARSASHFVPGHRSGRLHTAGLHKLMAGDDRIFRRKQEVQNLDVAVSLLVDCSGSMRLGRIPSKIEVAMLSAFALSQTLDAIKINHECLGFTTKHLNSKHDEKMRADREKLGIYYSRYEPLYMPIFKQFHETVNTTVKKRFAAAEHGVELRNNVDGECVAIAAERLAKQPEKRKILLVLSDGVPSAYGASHRAFGTHLKKTIGEVTQRGIETVGIGIMDDSVKSFYPRNIVINNITDLPSAVMGELKRILMR